MTKKLPSLRSIQQVAKKLFVDSEEQERFINSVLNPTPKPHALVWMDKAENLPQLESQPAPQYFPDWVTLAKPGSSPGKIDQHSSGKFYLMDPSSVYAMLPLLGLGGLLDRPVTVVDLCASPGGKSIFAYRALKPDSLISNEVIGNRIPALLSNLKRCGLAGSLVTQADPGHLSKLNPSSADVVLVDAPCSGQSLLAKSEQGLGCFSKPVINANVGRQRRILAEAAKIAGPRAYILYSTCTFSIEENERNIEWFKENFPEFSQISSGRMWPAEGLGAGSFFSLLKRERPASDTGYYSFDCSDIRHWVVR